MKKFFALFAFIVLAVSMTACLDKDGASSLQQQASNTPAKGQLPPTKEGADNRQFQTTATPIPASPTPMPTAQPQLTPGSYSLAGFPTSVPYSVVDTAKGGFTNTLGLFTEGWFAEPGKMLVGPDFDPALIKASNGAIEYANPTNQSVFETVGPSFFNCGEGGFVGSAAGQMTMELGDKVAQLNGGPGHEWLAYWRCPNSDGLIDTDFNGTVKFTGYTPGHIEAHRYPGNPGGGFISEGNFNQVTALSHSGGTDCGANGCSRLSVFLADANTGAWVVLTKDSPTAQWRLVATNIVR